MLYNYYVINYICKSCISYINYVYIIFLQLRNTIKFKESVSLCYHQRHSSMEEKLLKLCHHLSFSKSFGCP